MFSTAMEQLPRVLFCIKAKKQEKCWITSWTHIWRTSWGGCFSLKSFSEMLFKIEISNDSLTNSVLEKTLFCLNRISLKWKVILKMPYEIPLKESNFQQIYWQWAWKHTKVDLLYIPYIYCNCKCSQGYTHLQTMIDIIKLCLVFSYWKIFFF